eukprot:1145401-Pelagomonas_calceolata.AAC.22
MTCVCKQSVSVNAKALKVVQPANNRGYEVVPTPLTRLKWWRVVLDEAQVRLMPISFVVASFLAISTERAAPSSQPGRCWQRAHSRIGVLSPPSVGCALCSVWAVL